MEINDTGAMMYSHWLKLGEEPAENSNGFYFKCFVRVGHKFDRY